MIREVFSNIFQVKVPLPRNPLGHLNSYLINSEERKVLIDTGLNFPVAFQSLCGALTEIGVQPKELTDILLTHFHVDHVGLIPRFKKASRRLTIVIHHVEAELSKLMTKEFGDYRETVKTFLRSNGAPSAISKNLKSFHPAFFNPQAYQELSSDAISVQDGKEISVGDYIFQVKWTPGHSPGHICLYEPSLKILVSGDHLLPTITPHIAQFMEHMDPLTDYLSSLEKIEELDVDIVLPGHEQTFTGHQRRIRQLKNHHKQRLTEMVDELRAGRLTAYRLAQRVNWDINYKSWDQFPIFQKYLALGETVAHLNVLEQKRLVKRIKVDHTFLYTINHLDN